MLAAFVGEDVIAAVELIVGVFEYVRYPLPF